MRTYGDRPDMINRINGDKTIGELAPIHRAIFVARSFRFAQIEFIVIVEPRSTVG